MGWHASDMGNAKTPSPRLETQTVWDQLLPSAEAAAYLAVDVETLTRWRFHGIGPTYVLMDFPSMSRRSLMRNGGVRNRRLIRYRLSDLNAFVAALLQMRQILPRPVPGRPSQGRKPWRGSPSARRPHADEVLPPQED